MSQIKTNTIKGDSRERTKNLENITIMTNANKRLDINQNLRTNTMIFKDNTLQSANNHTNLLKSTKGYFNLEPCCDLVKQKATSLEDGLQTSILINSKTTIAQSSCNRQPLYDNNNCNTPESNMISNIPKNNFKYPIPLKKNSCCDEKRKNPQIQINSKENHTKYLPIMSKIKKYNYSKTQSIDSIDYPNFRIVNENNLVGYFNNDVYQTIPCCSSNQTISNTNSTNVGHKLKYSVQNTKTNCSCADNDDYEINTSSLPQQIPIASTNNSSFFSRKWSSNFNC
tara:strand:+ start:5027 stop:5875 length:849 start_codon:yes stop_codon:yes gene_type:complete